MQISGKAAAFFHLLSLRYPVTVPSSTLHGLSNESIVKQEFKKNIPELSKCCVAELMTLPPQLS
jgi:hypothetical protein